MRGADGDRAPGNGPDPHGWHTVGARSASGGDYQCMWGTNTMSGFRGSGSWSAGDVRMGGRTGEGFLSLLWSQSVGGGFSVTRELIRNADSQAASAPQNQDLVSAGSPSDALAHGSRSGAPHWAVQRDP